ncbi:MAG: RNA 2'-phosphotransferase, partial [Burkholderiales bacterium]|nr:RNA 2'-phosphotransferase [Anaerolineae bacterium]
VEVDLQLEPAVPPGILYHGTGTGSVENILKMGLLKFSRHHVHLSADMGTVVKVGSRHGKPVVFEVDAAAMHSDSYEFFCSENGVWLVDEVPPQYLKQLKLRKGATCCALTDGICYGAEISAAVAVIVWPCITAVGGRVDGGHTSGCALAEIDCWN